MARGFNYAPGASPEVLEAQQPGLHRTHIMALGSSRNTLVRANVAARTDCPLGLMVTLAHDYHTDVRSAVARNPTAQRTVMAYLAADRTPSVVLALLENPSLPADILEELAFHKKGAVRAAAAHRLDAGLVAAVEVEDAHTPELAEHVLPRAMDDAPAAAPVPAPAAATDLTSTAAPMATHFVPAEPHLDGAGAAVPVHPEPFATAPLAGSPALAGLPAASLAGDHVPPTSDPAPLAPTPPDAPRAEAHVPQIFAPHSTPEAPAPTRTAPVRGFKVRD